MAPHDEDVQKPECRENRDGKQKLFSFRSLLRKSRSSRSAGESIRADVATRPTVPSSKSCDVRLSAAETTDRRSKTYLLWKLLPPPGKSSGKSGCRLPNERMHLRTSFSCNDVCDASASRKAVRSSESSDVLDRIREWGPTCRHSHYRLRDDVTGPEDLSSPVPEDLSPLHRVMCKLCLTMVPAWGMYTLNDCSCTFCLTCLQQYLRINIREGNVTVTCPDAECIVAGKILISEIREIAGEDAFYMFERYKLNLDVELDPNRVWCPSAGCETVCSFRPSPDTNLGVCVLCVTCRTRFCSLCKLGWHGTTSCEDARKNSNDEIEFSASDDESPIKRCPNCRIPIEKDDGCAQMMCYRCKHVFCWHCLASLDDDFLLRHYDKGPCRNKLGHSRASMIWHRTQVVGIFAGFSFLLLMASPFLLLAAPCFFCCRCKNRFFYEEATPL